MQIALFLITHDFWLSMITVSVKNFNKLIRKNANIMSFSTAGQKNDFTVTNEYIESQLHSKPKRGMVKTATGQNGDKPKRLHVQSKRINLLSSTMDLLVNF